MQPASMDLELGTYFLQIVKNYIKVGMSPSEWSLIWIDVHIVTSLNQSPSVFIQRSWLLADMSLYRSLVNSKKFCVRFLARLSEMDQRVPLVTMWPSTVKIGWANCFSGQEEVLLHGSTWGRILENTTVDWAIESKGWPTATWKSGLYRNQEHHWSSLCLLVQARISQWAFLVGCLFPWASQFLPPTSHSYSTVTLVNIQLYHSACVRNKAK